MTAHIWQTPKTNWATSDPITTGDLNRVEGNILYLGEPISVTRNLVYTSGRLTQVNETVGGILWRRTDLTYTGDTLTSARTRVYASNGTTVVSDYTDTLTYISGELTSVTRTVTV
jgi:hypothetical protein